MTVIYLFFINGITAIPITEIRKTKTYIRNFNREILNNWIEDKRVLEEMSLNTMNIDSRIRINKMKKSSPEYFFMLPL